jgi:adenosylcobinamide-GDP ribazoletransferase
MRRFFSAVAFLTIIPIPERLKAGDPNAMFAGYPAVGLLIGGLLAAAAAASGAILPGLLAAVVLIGVNILLTGGIHLDGLADCADAFYGRRERERVLEILKDPRIGTMGGAAIGLSLLARFAAFTTLPAAAILLALPLSAMFARTSVIVGLRLLPYVRSQGGILAPGSTVSLLLTIVAAVILAMIGSLVPIPAAAALLAVGLLWLTSWRKIGGCTGDVLGASIELAEIAFLGAFAAEAGRGTLHGLLPVLLRAASASHVFPNWPM